MANTIIVIPSGVSTYVIEGSDCCGKEVTIASSVTYNVRYCGDYGAYYTNSHGGWDAFLFEGKCKKKDTFKSYATDRPFNNNTIEFETKTYLNDITEEYELNTGWLTDRQAENFAKNLVQSTTIYLHDLADNKIFPVVITDTEVEYKKFADDRKLVSYTLQVKASQKKIRR